MAGMFSYTPLKRREIRLLRIQAGSEDTPVEVSLSHVSLDSLPDYAALSYVWGDGHSAKTITLNGRDFIVRANLEAALRELRSRPIMTRPEDLYNGYTFPSFGSAARRLLRYVAEKVTAPQTIFIWIDAISINQEDILERNAQVKLMREIYKGASSLVVWLGPEEDDSHEAVRVINAFAVDFPSSIVNSDVKFEEWVRLFSADDEAVIEMATTSMMKFYMRPWYQRCW